MFLDFDKAIQFNPDTNNISDITLIATTNTNNTTEDIYQLNSLDSRLSIEDKKLTLLLTNILLPSAEYTFTLPQNFLLDDMDTGNEEYKFIFTTGNTIFDKSLLSINTTNWYETRSTDNGSFDQVITITYTYPAIIPNGVNNNDSLTGVFDTDLTDQIGTPTNPVTISGLPDGLKLRLSKQTEGIQLRLTGNATSHQKTIDNTSLKVTFLEDFFTLSKHYEYTSNDISFDFEFIFGTPHWGIRRNHQAFAYDDKLWILGGFNGVSIFNDIWTSDDGGNNWNNVAANGEAHWQQRYLYAAFAYQDKLWVMGGISTGGIVNDIWNSTDGGITWSQINVNGSHWDSRWSHQAFGYDDKLWVIGGSVSNDIWNSADNGTNWSQINVTGTHWTMKYRIQAFAYDNKLWVMGGGAENSFSSITNEIWNSSDGGTNWSQINVSGSHWASRSGHQAFAYDDKLWVLGGAGTDAIARNDIWHSADGGTNWSPVGVQGSLWFRRNHFQALAYDHKLWVFGGLANGSENDIWFSADDGVTWKEVDPFY